MLPRSHVKVSLQWSKPAVLFEWNVDVFTICIDLVAMIPKSTFVKWKVALYTGLLSPKGLQIKILIVGLNCNNHSLQFQQSQNISRSPFKMFKVPTLNKNKKEEDNNKKWKSFSVSLNRFELDDVIVSWRLLISQFWSFWSLQEYQRNMVYCN